MNEECRHDKGAVDWQSFFLGAWIAIDVVFLAAMVLEYKNDIHIFLRPIHQEVVEPEHVSDKPAVE